MPVWTSIDRTSACSAPPSVAIRTRLPSAENAALKIETLPSFGQIGQAAPVARSIATR
ncbi:MAG TPA: hypothetical protein VF469_34390 [Kofleriaceae bacterium]